LSDAFHGFGGAQVGGHDVVIVELHAVEPELLVFLDLGGKGHFLAHRRAERVGAHADVPGAEGETVGFFRAGHSSFLPRMPITTIVPTRTNFRSLRDFGSFSVNVVNWR